LPVAVLREERLAAPLLHVEAAGFYDPDGNPWMLAETTATYPGA